MSTGSFYTIKEWRPKYRQRLVPAEMEFELCNFIVTIHILKKYLLWKVLKNNSYITLDGSVRTALQSKMPRYAQAVCLSACAHTIIYSVEAVFWGPCSLCSLTLRALKRPEWLKPSGHIGRHLRVSHRALLSLTHKHTHSSMWPFDLSSVHPLHPPPLITFPLALSKEQK